MAIAPAPPDAPRRTARRARIESIDLVRGAIMILMALDHVRDFFGARSPSPTDLSQATAGLFLTRWITHFCAPGFFLLAGTGAFLLGRRRTTRELSTFLVTRGLWLIVLEAVFMRCLVLQFNFDYRLTLLEVLWALGCSMIALGALVRLPLGWIVGISVAMIAGHNLFDGVRAGGALGTLLHAPGFLINGEHAVFVAYPLIPWIGVMALGYALGKVYTWDDARRRAFLLRGGLALTAAFVVLRAMNVYGDPNPWSPQRSALYTVLSFLNTTKYPPSLLFLLMTVGPILLALRLFDRRVPSGLGPVVVIGRVPLFYFVLHFLAIHVLAVVVGAVRYGAIHWFFESPTIDRYPFTAPPGWGYSLPAMYLIWVGVVIALYPICRWYATVKARSGSTLLSYL
jgi:uncharacterized membrane protein